MDRTLKARTRIEMDLRRLGIPSIPVLGRYNYTRAMPGLETHRHAGAIEICYLVRGRQTYEVAGRRFSLRGGDVFLTFPGEAHGTGGEPEEKGLLYWVTLLDPAQTGGELLGQSPAESHALWSALCHLKCRHFPGKPEIKSHLDEITQLAHKRVTVLRRIAARNRLVALLLDILAAHQIASTPEKEQRIACSLAWIDSHIDSPDDLTIERLAEVAGLSPSRFQTVFKQQTGIPPAEFALRARIAEAQRRLSRRGADVTTVALALGFSSSQYFASAFKRFTNMQPRRVLQKKIRPKRLSKGLIKNSGHLS